MTRTRLSLSLSLSLAFISLFAIFAISTSHSQAATLITKQETSDYFSAGCFYPNEGAHRGMSIFRNGHMYNWETNAKGKEKFKNQVDKNRSLAATLFAIKDNNKWANESLNCPATSGESYCYLEYIGPTSEKQISWSADKVKSGICTLPPITKELYNQTVIMGADAMGVVLGNPQLDNEQRP